MYTPLPAPDNPWEYVTMDYMSGFPSTKHGHECVFFVVIRLSKMVILTPFKKSIISEVTAKLFFGKIWVHFGLTQTIISDRDNKFLGTFWSNL